MTWAKRNLWWIAGLAAVLVLSYVFYAVDPVRSVTMYKSAWRFATPLVLAAMVGVVGERSGVVNIGIEGQMLVAAFAGFFGAAATGSMLVGALFGVGAGLLLGGFLAWTTVKWQMDQIIAGVVLNIVATGITSFYLKSGKQLPGLLPHFDVPLLSKIPLFGPAFFQGTGIFAVVAIIVVAIIHIGLFRTRWGLRTRSVGEYPSAADTAGINVIRLRLINVTLAGVLAGMAGVYLSMDGSSSFERGMTAGRGFLALAIMIFGAWRPLRAAAAALFFGFVSAIGDQIQSTGANVPPQLVGTLPYVMTLIVLAIAAGKVRAPAADGQPYEKGGH